MEPWYNKSVFYHIYPLGYGENLSKIEENIEYLATLGVDALYLGPLFESETHGYDTIDYRSVDKRLGTNNQLKNIIENLHQKEIRVVLDGVFNHVSRQFFAYKNLELNKEKSPYINWFKDVEIKESIKVSTWRGHSNLVELNLDNNYVVEYLLESVGLWIEELDIDGLRLDVADCLSFDFMKKLKDYCSIKKKDFWIMGEVIHGDYRKWTDISTIDSVTNYVLYKGLYSSFNDSNFFEVAYTLNDQFNTKTGKYRDLNLYNFVDNHDVTRASSILLDKTDIYPLYLLLFTIPGIPSIYYGSELAYQGVKKDSDDLDLRKPFTNSGDHNLQNTIKKLISIWHSNPALQRGSYKELIVKHKQLAFLREEGNIKLIVMVNKEMEEVTLETDLNGEYYDILNNQRLNIDRDVTLYPKWGRILKKWN